MKIKRKRAIKKTKLEPQEVESAPAPAVEPAAVVQEAPAEAVIAPAEVAAPEPVKDPVKKPSGGLAFSKWYIGAGILAAAAAGCGVLYVMTYNIGAIVLLILLAALAYGCYYKGSKEIPSVPTLSAEAPTSGKVNCLCIYGTRDKYNINKAVKIQFENRNDEDLIGDRWYVEDLNKWLPVIYQDLDNGGKWAAFELPDSKYTDPARMAIPLNMSAVQHWRELDPNLYEKLKPLIMVGANALVLFFIYLMASSPAQGGG